MQRFNRQQGLSFVEMLITIAIFTIVIGVVVGSILVFYRGNTFAVEQAFAVESARRGVEIMVRDIREASFSDEGQYPIVNVDNYSMLIYSDIDRDDDVERVRFFLSTTTNQFIKVTTNSTGTPPTYDGGDASTSTIADNVRNDEEGSDIFEFFDSAGAEVTNFSNITDIVFVRVSLVVNINPIRLPNEFTIRSSATIRNLKTNQ